MFINTSYTDQPHLYQYSNIDIFLVGNRTTSFIHPNYNDYQDDSFKYSMGEPLLNESEVKPLVLFGRYFNQSINNYPEVVTYGSNEFYMNSNKVCDINYTYLWISEKREFAKTLDNSIYDKSPYTELSSSTINKLL